MTPVRLSHPSFTAPIREDAVHDAITRIRGYDELAAHFTLTEHAAVQLVHRARRNLVAPVA
jgi:hypothetical protein